MISRNEFLSYVIISLVVFILLVGIAFVKDRPDLSIPSRKQITEPDQNTPTQNNPEPSKLEIPQFLFYLILLAGAIALYLTIGGLRQYRNSRPSRIKMVTKSEKESIYKVKMARETAYQILREGLQNKQYTDAYIRAYQALDGELDYFREIARPKHFTPREYSFSVRPPIFRPSVYRFVQIFYSLRYGNQEAGEDDLSVFIQSLDELFTEDISKARKTELWEDFHKLTEEIETFQIPKIFDPTKPKGGKI